MKEANKWCMSHANDIKGNVTWPFRLFENCYVSDLVPHMEVAQIWLSLWLKQLLLLIQSNIGWIWENNEIWLTCSVNVALVFAGHFYPTFLTREKLWENSSDSLILDLKELTVLDVLKFPLSLFQICGA